MSVVLPQGVVDIGKICVADTLGPSDRGTWVVLNEWQYLDQDDPNYIYLKAREGVFKRSINYWYGSPYGWRKILPRHLDTWGFQI